MTNEELQWMDNLTLSGAELEREDAIKLMEMINRDGAEYMNKNLLEEKFQVIVEKKHKGGGISAVQQLAKWILSRTPGQIAYFNKVSKTIKIKKS